jgi:hypothetical protein
LSAITICRVRAVVRSGVGGEDAEQGLAFVGLGTGEGEPDR